MCGAGIFVLGLTTALGFSVLRFQPFAAGTTWLDFWDFVVSTNILPLGSLVQALFCCHAFGWGWDHFVAEANTGRGLKLPSRGLPKRLMQFYLCVVLPILILVILLQGL